MAQILSEVQWRLNALISGGGFSASLPVFDPNPVGLSGRDDKDVDVPFAQNASTSGHFAQQRIVRMMARGAGLGGVANCKLRCSKSFSCALSYGAGRRGFWILVRPESRLNCEAKPLRWRVTDCGKR